MVQVPSDLVSSRVRLGQNKVPRALSTVFGVGKFARARARVRSVLLLLLLLL